MFRLTQLGSLVVILTGLALVTPARAEIPLLINYQGQLKDSVGAPVEDGTYTMTFSIYRVNITCYRS